jgi:hypothetical protein
VGCAAAESTAASDSAGAVSRCDAEIAAAGAGVPGGIAASLRSALAAVAADADRRDCASADASGGAAPARGAGIPGAAGSGIDGEAAGCAGVAGCPGVGAAAGAGGEGGVTRGRCGTGTGDSVPAAGNGLVAVGASLDGCRADALARCESDRETTGVDGGVATAAVPASGAVDPAGAGGGSDGCAATGGVGSATCGCETGVEGGTVDADGPRGGRDLAVADATGGDCTATAR